MSRRVRRASPARSAHAARSFRARTSRNPRAVIVGEFVPALAHRRPATSDAHFYHAQRPDGHDTLAHERGPVAGNDYAVMQWQPTSAQVGVNTFTVFATNPNTTRRQRDVHRDGAAEWLRQSAADAGRADDREQSSPPIMSTLTWTRCGRQHRRDELPHRRHTLRRAGPGESGHHARRRPARNLTTQLNGLHPRRRLHGEHHAVRRGGKYRPLDEHLFRHALTGTITASERRCILSPSAT